MDKRSIDDILETIKPLTDEEKVAYLFDIIHEEVSKPWNEVDQELVAACSECAEKYNRNVAPALTKDDVEQRLVEFKQNYGKRVRKPIRTNWVRKAAIIASAAVLTCFLTLTVAARASGFKNIGEFVVYAVNNLFPGESVDENRITYIYDGEIRTYKTLDEWCEEQGGGMLYPSALPEGVIIEKIIRNDNEDGTHKLAIIFNDETLSMVVNNYYSVDLDTNKHPSYTTSDGLVFNIVRESQAVYQTNKHEYIIQTKNKEWMIIIMEGLRK